MGDLLKRLKERKMVQWALAYVAAAWVIIEVLSVLGEMFGLPVVLQRGAVVALAFGLALVLVFAWYHGEKGRQKVSGPELLIVAILLVVAGATIHLAVGGPASEGERAVEPGSTAPEPALDARSVAILPFRDLSPNGDHRYLSDGIAEELIGVLSRVDGLRVASRTASFSAAEAGLELEELGRRLGVLHVVEGSVRRSEDRLRIQATLLGVDDGFPLWSERFDTDASDIFAVQDSIALAVAEALEIRLADGRESLALPGQTDDFRAQNLYFQGRYAWNRRTRDGLEQAVAYFDSAVARDSSYARAFAGLGDAHAVLGFYDYRPPEIAFPLAQEAARRALAIDSALAEPYATLGYAALYYEWDLEEAEDRFRRAIRLDPGYPVAHQWYANLLTAMGRFVEAESEMRRASELDPLSMIAFAAIGWVDYYAGNHGEAIRQLEAAAARDSTFELAHLWSGQAHAALGRFAGAETRLRRAVELSEGSAISRAALARVVADRGRDTEARAILDDLERAGRRGYVPSFEIARAYVGLGEPDRALTWLERAADERAHSMVFLRVDPQLEPLRDHPRFHALLDRTGL